MKYTIHGVAITGLELDVEADGELGKEEATERLCEYFNQLDDPEPLVEVDDIEVNE